MERVKTLLTRENAKACIEFLKTSGFSYTLKISNYTTEIVSELYNIQYLQSMRGKACFAAAAKIKKDINGKEKPDINKHALSYFNHDFKKDFDAPEVINIDLRSAYATALYNNGILTKPTFEYLGKIPKLDRLASVGMLASKKYVFDYNEEGKLINYRKEVNPNENFFYYAVAIVEEVMNALRVISNHHYLFTWVDGIYIKNDLETLVAIGDYLDSIDFRYSIEVLKDFKVRLFDNKVKLSFFKNDKEKQFHIPAKPSMLAVDIINFLTDQNVKENENLLIKNPKLSND